MARMFSEEEEELHKSSTSTAKEEHLNIQVSVEDRGEKQLTSLDRGGQDGMVPPVL